MLAKNGQVSADIKDVLKRTHEKETGSANEFDAYMTALQTEALAKRLAEIKASI